MNELLVLLGFKAYHRGIPTLTGCGHTASPLFKQVQLMIITVCREVCMILSVQLGDVAPVLLSGGWIIGSVFLVITGIGCSSPGTFSMMAHHPLYLTLCMAGHNRIITSILDHVLEQLSVFSNLFSLLRVMEVSRSASSLLLHRPYSTLAAMLPKLKFNCHWILYDIGYMLYYCIAQFSRVCETIYASRVNISLWWYTIKLHRALN